MRLEVTSDILEKFPSLNLGVVIAKSINNQAPNEKAKALLLDQATKTRDELQGITLSEHPRILAWREAYRQFGAKPKKNKPSVETLAKMALSGLLRSINPLVDIYNSISLKHLVPMGGDDLDKIEGDITLCFAKGEEQFIPLGSSEPESPKAGEVVYRDSNEILCRRWNWRECDKSKMTEETTTASFVIEALDPVTVEEVKAASEELASLLQEHCGATTECYFLSSSQPTCHW